MEDRIIEVTNRYVGTVSYKIDSPSVQTGIIKRTFAPNETKRVHLSELVSLNYTNGGKAIIKNYLLIRDKDALKELGLNVEPEYFYTEETIKNILLGGSLDELEDLLNFAPEGVKESVKTLAVELEIPDVRKRNMIYGKTGFNVDNNILINQQMSADDQPIETEQPKRKTKGRSSEEDNKPTRKTTPVDTGFGYTIVD